MMASVINGAGSVSVQAALLCTCVSLVLGLVIAAVYMLQGEYTKNFVVTLLLLPALVQAVIMLVNGNLGTGGDHGCIQSGAFPVCSGYIP